MSRPRYYSPAIKRHLVTVLYHEAKRQGRPMTHLANDILERALRPSQPPPSTEPGTVAMILHDAPPPLTHNNTQPPRP